VSWGWNSRTGSEHTHVSQRWNSGTASEHTQMSQRQNSGTASELTQMSQRQISGTGNECAHVSRMEFWKRLLLSVPTCHRWNSGRGCEYIVRDTISGHGYEFTHASQRYNSGPGSECTHISQMELWDRL